MLFLNLKIAVTYKNIQAECYLRKRLMHLARFKIGPSPIKSAYNLKTHYTHRNLTHIFRAQLRFLGLIFLVLQILSTTRSGE